jgi:hypothetical protein
MIALLEASLTFPAVIFTGVLALALIYWLFVMLGALDLDVLGGAEGGAEGVDVDIDGVAKGALEGAVKGSLEGAAKGAAEGLADVDEEGGLADLFAALHLNRAPATVVLTLIATFGWLTSVLALLNLAETSAGWGLPGWLFKAVVLLVSIVIALPLTSLVVRPLGPLFAIRSAEARKDLVGRVAIISTGRVDDRFGQAMLQDGGAGLILDVRCDTPGLLRKGDRALLVSWDEDKEVFHVEPMEDLMERRIKQIADTGAGGGHGQGAAQGASADAGAATPAEVAAEDEARAAEEARHRTGGLGA